jgi:Nucleoside 2-deoxyribosyltransferase like
LSAYMAEKPKPTASKPVNGPSPQSADKCRFCKRPSHCPQCSHALDPTQESNGAVNISGEIEDTHSQLPATPEPELRVHPMFRHCMPPEEPEYQEYSVFLAGSIEMGKAVQWQRLMASYLQDLPISAYNPRRGHWDPKATPEARNKDFRHQVEWELEALTRAKVICFFFDHTTLSPVTMCELGLWADSGKVVVCCDKRFWKSGNVHLVCERYGIPYVETFEELIPLTKAMLREKGMMLDSQGNLMDDPANEDRSRLPDNSILKSHGWRKPASQ